MKCTYLGHSCFLLEIDNHTILVDPFINDNPLAENVDIASIKPDYMLVSHAHGDHCADVEYFAKQSSCTLIANYEIVNHFANKGIQGFAMNSGGTQIFPFGTLIMTHAYHSSSFPDGSYGGNPNGFIIQTNEACVFYSGDTSLTMDFALIAQRYSIDMAFLPIGNVFTMDHIDAARACTMLKAKRCMGLHFDTFPPITIDHDGVKGYMQSQNISFILPNIGEEFSIP